MTQSELIWCLLSIIQLGVISFVGYWTRRVQRLEEVLTTTMEQRTKLLIEYQGRVSRLEAQFETITDMLVEIKRSIERNDRRIEKLREEEEE